MGMSQWEQIGWSKWQIILELYPTRSQLPRPREVQRDLLASVHALLPSLALQINTHLPQLGFQSVEEFAVLIPRLQENHPPNQQHPLSPCS